MGTAFFMKFSESYQFIFRTSRSIRERLALRYSGFFYFQKVFILRIDWSELIMWIKQKGHWLEDG